jgi:hypothetical protein
MVRWILVPKGAPLRRDPRLWNTFDFAMTAPSASLFQGSANCGADFPHRLRPTLSTLQPTTAESQTLLLTAPAYVLHPVCGGICLLSVRAGIKSTPDLSARMPIRSHRVDMFFASAVVPAGTLVGNE